MSSFRNQTVQATSWVLIVNVVSQAVSFCYGIVLARLLVPDDFGLMAMALFFAGIAVLFVDTGFGQALIQKRDVTEVHFSSIFWLNLCLSVGMGLVMFFTAGIIADFYQRHEIETIFQIVSINFVFTAMGFIPRMRLSKDLNFKKISIIDFQSMVLSGVIAISAAYTGFGYWSLVIHIVLQQVLRSFMLWHAAGWRPGFVFSIIAIKELFSFSAYLFGTRVLQYGAMNVDKLLLGKFVGGHSLGVYDKAQSMMLTPLNTISRSIVTVMFPSMSIIQADKKRVREVYLRTTRAVTLIVFPMLTGVFVIADTFVFGVLGEQWREVIPVLRLFCIAGMFSAIASINPAVYQSQGATSLQFKLNLLTQPLKIAAVFIGVNWGIMGVAISLVGAISVTTLITVGVAGRLIKIRFVEFIKSIVPVFIASMSMGAIIFAVTYIVNINNYLVLLGIQVVVGALFFWIILIVGKVDAYTDVVRVVKTGILKKENRGS